MARRRRYSAEFKREAVEMTRVPRPVQYSCADGRFGSLAALRQPISSMAAIECKAAIQVRVNAVLVGVLARQRPLQDVALQPFDTNA